MTISKLHKLLAHKAMHSKYLDDKTSEAVANSIVYVNKNDKRESLLDRLQAQMAYFEAVMASRKPVTVENKEQGDAASETPVDEPVSA